MGLKSEGNPGFSAGIGKRSQTERLAWALKGAPMRTKDLRLNAVAAVAEGRKLRDRVSARMINANADPEDAMVFCVFAEPDLSGLFIHPGFTPVVGVKNGESDIALASAFVDKLPIGFLVFVWDRKQQSIVGHTRPLIVEDPRAKELNDQALRVRTQWIKRVLMERGAIRDERN